MSKRVHYVALVWKFCDTTHPNLSPPTLHGWKDEGVKLQVTSTTLLLAAKAALQLNVDAKESAQQWFVLAVSKI